MDKYIDIYIYILNRMYFSRRYYNQKDNGYENI